MFAVIRFPETIKASSGFKICMNQNTHKGVPQAVDQAAWWLSEVLMKVTCFACLKSLWDTMKSFGYDLLSLEIDMLAALQAVGWQYLVPVLLYYPIDPVHVVEDLGVEAVACGTADSPRNDAGSHPPTTFPV